MNLANKNIAWSLKFEFRINYGHTYTFEKPIVYLKFRFAWAPCILPGNPGARSVSGSPSGPQPSTGRPGLGSRARFFPRLAFCPLVPSPQQQNCSRASLISKTPESISGSSSGRPKPSPSPRAVHSLPGPPSGTFRLCWTSNGGAAPLGPAVSAFILLWPFG